MSLKWVQRPVDTPYGTIPTLHRAVVHDAPGVEEEDIEASVLHDAARKGSDRESIEADEEAEELEIELERSADLLGSVLWNSNSTALYYLHEHIFHLPLAPVSPPGGRESSSPSSSSCVWRYTGDAAPLRRVRVVELGAGVGVLGIALAMAGASVVISDIPELLPLMEKNLERNRTAIRRASNGVGKCAAVGWKWGPSVSMNLKKILQRSGSSPNNSGGVALVNRILQSAIRTPSEPWAETQRLLLIPQHNETTGSKKKNSRMEKGEAMAGDVAVDYIVMCDALYGNPKDWPALLFTLSEMLLHSLQTSSSSSAPAVILNFCEQRVQKVEGAFLELLEAENVKPMWGKEDEEATAQMTKAARDAFHTEEEEWQRLLEAIEQSQPAEPRRNNNKQQQQQQIRAAVSVGSSSPSLLTEAPRILLNRLLRQMRGPYVWAYECEMLQPANAAAASGAAPPPRYLSDLQMPICVTRITWRKRGSGTVRGEDGSPQQTAHRKRSRSA
eukprot:gene6800-4880_t